MPVQRVRYRSPVRRPSSPDILVERVSAAPGAPDAAAVRVARQTAVQQALATSDWFTDRVPDGARGAATAYVVQGAGSETGKDPIARSLDRKSGVTLWTGVAYGPIVGAPDLSQVPTPYSARTGFLQVEKHIRGPRFLHWALGRIGSMVSVHLREVYVAPSQQRLGIAHALVDAALRDVPDTARVYFEAPFDSDPDYWGYDRPEVKGGSVVLTDEIIGRDLGADYYETTAEQMRAALRADGGEWLGEARVETEYDIRAELALDDAMSNVSPMGFGGYGSYRGLR